MSCSRLAAEKLLFNFVLVDRMGWGSTTNRGYLYNSRAMV